MKESINIKLFLTVSLLLILVILSVLLLNTTVLEYYYRSQKEISLTDTYFSARDYYSTHKIDSTSAFVAELQKIDSTRNIEIVVCDIDNNVLFSSSSNFINNGFFVSNGPFVFGLRQFSFEYLLENLSDSSPYFIKTFSDTKLNSEFMTLCGRLKDGYLIFIRTPIEAIRESVKISNSFLIIVGSVCVLISSIITFLISKAFTKPIKELNEIALSMANLDFSKKYIVSTNDEVGMLGESINKLSDNLQKTIQDLKEANIDLEKDVEEKSKLNEMRSQFISDVSHELKTPIALIQGYAEGLIDGILSDEESKKYYCEVILDEANKMSNLTKDLLDLSRLEYGKNELKLDTFNLTDLVANTLKKNELLFNEKNVTCEFLTTTPIYVIADFNRIEQVLTNYISNALKHVCNENLIRCNIQDKKNVVRISVFNSGKNISEEDLSRVWTRFYKVDSSRNRTNGGTGLGLSLVKAIMLQHKNKFGVNNLENGVEFWFELNKDLNY